jgi:hypothetical protein
VVQLSCDVVVLGSSLGGLVASAYLARLGLRVIVIEEEAQTKRSPLLREPFLLSGFGPGGPLRGVLRELSLPLREQAELEPEPVAPRVLLPSGEFTLSAERERWADGFAELAGISRAESAAWLGRSEAAAERLRAELWNPPRRVLGGWWPLRHSDELRPALPTPEPIESLLVPLLGALHPLAPPPTSPAAQMGLSAVLAGGLCMPLGVPFAELFRRRLRARHGEIYTTDVFGLASAGGQLQLSLLRGSFRARGLVIAAPLEPLRRVLEETGGAPEWWRPAPELLRCLQRLFRIEPGYSAPEETPPRRVSAGEGENELIWYARYPDPAGSSNDWLLAAGPGAAALSPHNPLGRSTPFPRGTVVPIEGGPEPRWDLSAGEIRLRHSPRLALPARLPITHVGPERSGLLGLEGEVLQARSAALELAARLGARRLP